MRLFDVDYNIKNLKRTIIKLILSVVFLAILLIIRLSFHIEDAMLNRIVGFIFLVVAMFDIIILYTCIAEIVCYKYKKHREKKDGVEYVVPDSEVQNNGYTYHIIRAIMSLIVIFISLCFYPKIETGILLIDKLLRPEVYGAFATAFFMVAVRNIETIYRQRREKAKRNAEKNQNN